MGDDKRARLKQWLANGEATLQPLTFPQRELWEATPVPPGSPANHICCLIHVRGRLTAEDCHSVMRRVVERQEALRLSILPGKEGALQMIRRQCEANLVYLELTKEETAPEAIEARAQQVFHAPFDLLQGPLYRTEAWRCAEDVLTFAFAIHHAVADGWSLGVLVQDLAGAYVQAKAGLAREPLPAVPQSYSAWGAAERMLWSPVEVAQRAEYWRKTLAGAPRPWGDYAPEAVAQPLERWALALPEELGRAATALARRAGATLFTTLLSAFRIAVAQCLGAEDLVVGTPVANRHSANSRETIGSYAGVVPLRGQVAGGRSFLEFLRQVHGTSMEAFSRALPFAELIRVLGDLPRPGHHPIFAVRFALQNHPIPDVDLGSIKARLRMRSTGTARFDLGCEITEMAEGLEVVWLWRASLFRQSQLEELSRTFQSILTAACQFPENPITLRPV